MWLTKDGITIEVVHPAEIRRLKAAGFQAAEREPASVSTETVSPAEKNEAAIQAVNDSPATPTAEPDDLGSLTVADLKELAKERGLEGYSSLNKADLIALLEGGAE